MQNVTSKMSRLKHRSKFIKRQTTKHNTLATYRWTKQLHDSHSAVNTDVKNRSKSFWCHKMDLDPCVFSDYEVQVVWTRKVAHDHCIHCSGLLCSHHVVVSHVAGFFEVF